LRRSRNNVGISILPTNSDATATIK
jgi:hypothetical protein